MDKKDLFFSVVQKIEEKTYTMKLKSSYWTRLAEITLPYVEEKGKFDNVHLCWQYSLASILKKILSNKETKKGFKTIKLKGNEFYAFKEILENSPLKHEYELPIWQDVQQQIKRVLLNE